MDTAKTKLITTVIDPHKYAERLIAKLFEKKQEALSKPNFSIREMEALEVASKIVVDTMVEMTDEAARNV